MLVKADLHIHTSEDPHDVLAYSAMDVIDHAAKNDIRAIAITCHHLYFDQVSYPSEYEYAERKGILLIPGGEKSIVIPNKKKGPHVLIYNIRKNIFDAIQNFEDLREVKTEFPDSLIVAPHYRAPYESLNGYLEEYIDLFDAIEWTHIYHKLATILNSNIEKISEKHNNLPIVGGSDAHFDYHLGKNSMILEVRELTRLAIINAIKHNDIVSIDKKPLTTFQLARELFSMYNLIRKVKKRIKDERHA